MPLVDRKYKENQAILKDYGGKFYKLICFKCLRTSGIECEVNNKRGSANNTEKLEQSISRARSMIYELAVCNPWSYWVTFTIDPKKYDRANLDKFRQDLSQWTRNQGKKHNSKIKYLLVPEQHKRGNAWHMHGFINGIPEIELRKFTLQEKIPKYIREKVISGDQVYDWTAYRNKFGWTVIEPIRNPEACSKYITKYLSKDIAKDIQTLGAHLYYSSQGLQRALELKKGTMLGDMIPSFENEYIRVQIIDKNEDIETIKSMIL